MTYRRSIDRRQPRIGYVLKRYPRFSETFVVHEILAHERAGLAIDIFALRPVAETHFQDVLGRVRSPVVRIPEKMRNAPTFWTQLVEAGRHLPGFWQTLERIGDTNIDDLSQAVALGLEIDTRGIEHLHAHFGTVATTVARLAARFTGITYSFTAHAKDIYFRYDEPVNLDVKLRDAAAVVTISEYNLHHLRERFAADAANTNLIYNGLDLSGLPWREPVSTAREILAVGRLIEKKGFHVLIEAARLLHERGVDFTLRIVGAGSEEANLQDQIERSGLGELAVLDGPRPQSEVIACMREAALLAAPCVVGEDGNRDGLPTVLLEAMAVGTPCIATDVTGIPELVHDGETGLIAPEGDPDTLADKIERLLGDADLRRRLSAAGRARIERDFDIDVNTQRLRDLFDLAIARGKSALRGVA